MRMLTLSFIGPIIIHVQAVFAASNMRYTFQGNEVNNMSQSAVEIEMATYMKMSGYRKKHISIEYNKGAGV